MNFDQICKAIKEVRIQGADNVAIAAIKAYAKKPIKSSIKKLEKLRPTEPALRNALSFVGKDIKNIPLAISHFEVSKELIAEYGSRIIKQNMIVYTHCHSSSVINVFKKAKENKKRFIVRNTETRPLYQGRKTSKDLSDLKIPNTHFIDAAMRLAIKKSDLVLLGADAITTEGKVINKIGSELVCETAERFDVPVYICTNSWKFDPKTVFGFSEKIEERPEKEIWDKPPKRVTIVNPAFESIDSDLITGVISELGVLTPENFMSQVRKKYLWMFE